MRDRQHMEAAIKNAALDMGITRKIMANSEKVMKGGRTQDEIKAEIRETKRAKTLRLMVKYGPTALNNGWKFMIWIASVTAWLLMLPASVLFAGAIVEGLDTSTTFGQWSAIAVYIVCIGTGCKAAWDAGKGIKEQFGGVKW